MQDLSCASVLSLPFKLGGDIPRQSPPLVWHGRFPSAPKVPVPSFLGTFFNCFFRQDFNGFWASFWEVFGLKFEFFAIFCPIVFRFHFRIDFFRSYDDFLTPRILEFINFLVVKRYFLQNRHFQFYF